MRPEQEPSQEEQEVDLRSLWQRLVAHWWLPLLALVAGGLVGIAAAAGGGQVFRGETLLYLGQPFGTGGQITSLATNPRTASEIIRSEAALERAANESGLPMSRLRGHVTSQAVTTTGQTRITSPLVVIAVEGPSRDKVEKAADALATEVIERVATYVDRKIELLEQQIKSSQDELERVDQRVSTAVSQLDDVRGDRTLSSAEKLIATTSLNSTIGFAEQRRGTVQQELFQNQQLLSLAVNVEKSRIVEPAVARKTTATSRRNGAVVGAVIGLILGSLGAWVLEPLRRRRRPAA